MKSRADFTDHSFKRRYRKKALGPAEKRELVGYAREDFGMSLQQACAVFCLSTSVFYYREKRKDGSQSSNRSYNQCLYCWEK
ncbi:hypothetical protein GNY06_00865 [Elizabethkingia argentiflava]|uniref:Uncharacterized protein n=1 Tax=Elizabethkingia argenteiflava TaxID=2681556 RepID=A0A845PQ99_9FLAO|nr:hypothetical protein [Elizabethkingia argenteiflava]NAW50004.1 hypothetical protein [Elizabethkingia argenteiflava]